MAGGVQIVVLVPVLLAVVQASQSCQQSCDLFPKIPGVLHTDKCWCDPGMCGNTGSETELHDCPKDFDFSQLYAGAEFYTYKKDPKGYKGYDECGYNGAPMPHDNVTSLCQDRDAFNDTTCEGIGIDATCFVGFNSKYGANLNFFQSIALAQPHVQGNTVHFWASIENGLMYGNLRASWGNTSSEAVAGLSLPNPGVAHASASKSKRGPGGCPDLPCGSSAVVV